jgi:hypothetical protein
MDKCLSGARSGLTSSVSLHFPGENLWRRLLDLFWIIRKPCRRDDQVCMLFVQISQNAHALKDWKMGAK